MARPKSKAAVHDGLANVVTGLGTSADKNSFRAYFFAPLDRSQAESAYRTSWLTRKIVDVPPSDMVRNWREWQATPEQIEAIEAEEKRHAVKRKLRRALILARLFGGGALIVGTRNGDATQPLAAAGKDGLAYLHVVSRHQLSYTELEMDPESPWFGEPKAWVLVGSSAMLHPSRVITFRGQEAPEGSVLQVDSYWGDPIMQSIGDAVANADLSQAGFATLINEASVDIIGIPDFMSQLPSAEYEAAFMRRLTLAQLSKSTHRALLKDANETWETRQVSWAGMPDIINTYLSIVAGAADIPITRLLGKSPGGLGSNGDGEERDYLAMILAQQEAYLRPALERLDAVLVPSALGSFPPEVYWQFAPLVQETPKEKIDTEKAAAETLKVYGDGGLVPMDVLAKVAANRMIESGEFPGVEQALAEAEAALAAPAPDDNSDPSALAADPPAPVADAAPRTLYVRRDVVNVDEIAAWAASQGLPELQPGLHVTIVYSRAPVDWMKVESDWNNGENGGVTIPPGGARLVEPLGDRTAVLLFNSSLLSWRHESIIRAGASHDWPDYQPHISLTGEPVDLSGVEPYRGHIVLGPEVFEELKAD